VEPDLDDTVIKPVRPLEHEYRVDDGDTMVRSRRAPADVDHHDTGIPQPSAVRAEYAFVVNSHPPIPLDRPAYVGRKPSAPRVSIGDRPRLVRVPSPLGEVSGTHLELRHIGSSVTVTDLRSTNGTTVRLPGSTPVRLRQGESAVVTPGSVIEVGDGNVIEIHSLRRAYPSDPEFGANGS
jgi:hypothetical protein